MKINLKIYNMLNKVLLQSLYSLKREFIRIYSNFKNIIFEV